jgi:hypothetical protein
VSAQSELGGKDPYFWFFLIPEKKEENVVGFYPFFSPSQRNQIFSGGNNKHTQSKFGHFSFFFFVFFSPSAKSIKERGGRLGKRKIRKTSSLHRKEENPIKKKKKLYSFFELSAWNTRRKSVSVVGGSAGGIFFFFPL